MTRQGGCYCGDVRYEVSGKPILQAQCHCRACQHISGGGANYFMLVNPDDFSYVQGDAGRFTRGDLPDAVTREFCSNCGTHLLVRRPGLEALVLKIGTLDNPAFFNPQMAIFTAQEQTFHLTPEDMPKFEGLPTRGKKEKPSN